MLTYRSLNQELASPEETDELIKQSNISALTQPIKQQLDDLFIELGQLWEKFNKALRNGELKHLRYDENDKALHLQKIKVDKAITNDIENLPQNIIDEVRAQYTRILEVYGEKLLQEIKIPQGFLLRPYQDIKKLTVLGKDFFFQEEAALTNPEGVHAELNIQSESYIGVSMLCCYACNKTLGDAIPHRGTHNLLFPKTNLIYDALYNTITDDIIPRDHERQAYYQQRKMSTDMLLENEIDFLTRLKSLAGESSVETD